MAANEDLLKELMAAQPSPASPRTPTRPAPRRKTWLHTYEEASLRGALGATFLLWLAVWVVDGYFTVLFLGALFPAIPWYVGAIVHIGVSLIQNYLWRDGGKEHALTLFLIILFNVGTSLVGALQQFAAWTAARPLALLDIATIDIPHSSALTVIACAAALVIAIAPERQARKYGYRLF